jgi:hypothetical protein
MLIRIWALMAVVGLAISPSRSQPTSHDLASPLTTTAGYDAWATLAPDGTIAFTSVRDGDMEIYTMRVDGSDVRRLTRRPGPDGGPFFSWDGKQIAYRGHPLQPGQEYDDYLALFEQHLWRPTKREIYVMDLAGCQCTTTIAAQAEEMRPAPVIHLERFDFADLLSEMASRTSAVNADASMSSPSWMSIARRTWPSRLALKRCAGSFSDAPLANVSFTALL